MTMNFSGQRDGEGLGDNFAAAVKKRFKINIAGAQNVAGLASDLSNCAVAKTEFLDIKSALVAAGVDAKDSPAEIEGIAFGKNVSLNVNFQACINLCSVTSKLFICLTDALSRLVT
ncbi:MAG: hypothetical protein EOO68_04270 [Moraxellaceae bacterium]|nr:MAG: hypothetical protein EOO68_04270 [Moraxellaceae bacterium]